jgi:hypothetical protein
MQKNGTLLKRVREFVASSNSVLNRDMLNVSGNYRTDNGRRLVEVTIDMSIVYSGLIQNMCLNTHSTFYGITQNVGRICVLLSDKTEEDESYQEKE